MSNDVLIHVRVRQDARDGFAAVGKEAEKEGHKAGEKFTGRFGNVVGRMGQLLAEPIRKAGQHIGGQLGEHSGNSFVQKLSTVVTSSTSKLVEISKAVGQKIGATISGGVAAGVDQGVQDGLTRGADGRLRDSRGRFVSGARSGGAGGDGGRGGRGGAGGGANVDVDKQSLLSRFAEWGKDSALSFWGTFSSGVSNFFSGDFITLILKSIGFAALGLVIAVPLSAAIANAVLLALGGGVIALGVVAALKDPRIVAAAGELKTQFAGLLAEFGKPFRGPVADFLERLSRDILPTLRDYAPVIASVFAPLTKRLGDGIIGFIQNLLPGLVDAMIGAAPVIETIADRLPDIGQGLGDFFREMGENGEDASVFLDDLITILLKVLDLTGKFIGANVRLYANTREFLSDMKALWLGFGSYVVGIFERLLVAASVAFSWVPGLSGKLAGARAAFRDARADINAELAKIKDKTVNIRVRTFGLAGANAAVGVAERLAALGYAAGGIVGQLPQQIGQAATGGVRNGLTWVGERGPELANLAPGSKVWSAGDSQRMAGGGGDDFVAEAEFIGSSDPLVDQVMRHIKIRVTRRFGGSVQTAMGA